MIFAVILAAGQSRRMKKTDKIFCEIQKKPLVFCAIEIFEKHPEINKIILVSRKKHLKKLSSLIEKYRFKKIAAVIEGGEERQDSAYAGLREAEKLGAKKEDLILFHNAANPFVARNEITNVIEAAKKHKAALVGQAAKDTLKKVDENGFVLKTVDRKNIYLAQTPQIIEYALAKKAFEKAEKEKFKGTDDVSLVERLGKKVKIVPCSYRNIKITTRDDLIKPTQKHF